MNYTPLNNFILLKEIGKQEENKTVSGIIIASDEEVLDKFGHAIVVKHGLPVMLANGSYTTFNTKIGQKVMFKKFGTYKIEIDGEEYLQCYESNLMGIYDDNQDNESKIKYASDIANGK